MIVSVYYRLDSFGFLSVPAFHESPNGDFNVGFQDQIRALRWVQKNIHAFGGDPSRVTINGQSAGGNSVELHLIAHESRKLFSGAIAQSVYRAPLPTPEEQKVSRPLMPVGPHTSPTTNNLGQPLFEFYALQAGCGSGPVQSQLACLRNASVSTLARAQDASTSAQLYEVVIVGSNSCSFHLSNGSYKMFLPVLDGKIIADLPTRSILAGNSARVPLVVGYVHILRVCHICKFHWSDFRSTSNETVAQGGNITASLKSFFPKLNRADLKEFLKAYPEDEFTGEDQRFQVATGEPELICAVSFKLFIMCGDMVLLMCPIDQRAIMGGAYAQSGLKTWTYRYNQPNPTSGSDSVGHAAENWMMFWGTNTGYDTSILLVAWVLRSRQDNVAHSNSFNGSTTFTPMTPVEVAFSEELIAYWLSFVRSGDPNTHKLARSPTWSPYLTHNKSRIVFQQDPQNTTTHSGCYNEYEPSKESRRCQFVARKVAHERD